MRAHNGPPAAAFRPVPRGLLGRISANGDPRAILAGLQTAFEGFKAEHRGHLDNVGAELDDINRRLAALGAGVGGSRPVEDPGYSTPFASYVRSGQAESEIRTANATGERARIMAALSVGTDSAGGYLAPLEWDRQVRQALRFVSPLRQLCDVQSTKTRGFSTVWSDGQHGSGWVGETAARPNTSTPTMSAITYTPGEIYANPLITQQLLDDADFDVAGWLANELATVFAQQEGLAFSQGDGVNKPRGWLRHVSGGPDAALHPGGAITTVASGAANGINPDGLVNLVYDLGAPYRQGSTFVMSSITASLVTKLKDTTGAYLWRQTLQADQPSTLLGYPVAIDENMPAPVAGNTPIAFGNWQLGYLINDRAGLKILRDPYSSKPFVQFYCTRRVGGGVKDPRALRVLRIAAG